MKDSKFIEDLLEKARSLDHVEHNTPTLHIAVHDGMWHADELLALAVLEVAICSRVGICVDRTRDPAKLKQADICIDVGGGEFDHHNPSCFEAYPNGVTMAACGKVLRAVFDTDDQKDADVRNILLNSLFYAVEERDNRGPNSPLPFGIEASKLGFVPITNPTPVQMDTCDQSEIDSMFWEAYKLVRTIYCRALKHARDKVTADFLVATAGTYKGAFVEISNGAFNTNARGYNDTTILGAVYKDSTPGAWCVRTQNDSPDRGSSLRVSLPEEWGGLECQALKEKSGLPGLKFVHRGLWLAVCENRETAEKVMDLLIERHANA